MPFNRVFLDWSKPALPSVAEYLVARYGGNGVTDLSGVVVVVTGRRAARRLLEILLEQTDGRLIPPRTITEGEFPELLYAPQRPFAGQLVQHLAWAEAVRRMPRDQANHVLREVPEDGDVDGWMALGELLWRLHRELAAELLDFGDVLREGEQIAGFNERARWETLQAVQQEYLEILDRLGLWDRQTARIVAVRERECQTECDIVLVGTVDLNRSTRAMLDQVTDRVTALVHAPEALKDRFDEHGCLQPEPWLAAPIPLAGDQIRVADKPHDQADAVVRALAELKGDFRADDITIGVADESLVPILRRRLKQYGVTTRWAVGKMLPQTRLMRLLGATAEYLDFERADAFAALVRHPDIVAWLAAQGIEPQWLSQLDDYLCRHLPQRLGFWLGPEDKCRQVRRAHELVTDLITELKGEPRPLPEWSGPVFDLLRSLIGEIEFDPEKQADRMELEAVDLLSRTFEEQATVPESLLPTVTGAQALRLTVEQLSQESVPPEPDETAVDLAGWLELPLDDAPVLIVTSFNEEFVPASAGADLFLPNRLRQELNVLDNDRRYSRDAYALSTLCASREHLVVIAGRRNSEGDPLLPSRLLFACEAEEAARRVMQYYTSPLPSPLPLAGPDEPCVPGAGIFVPRPLPLVEPVSVVAVTAFRAYLACPYRFYLQHVLGLCCVPHDVDEMDGGVFGTLIHDALKCFGRSEVRNSTSTDEIAAFLDSTIENDSRRMFGRYPLPAVIIQVEQARQRLAAFARWQASRAMNGWTIAYTEASTDGGQLSFGLGRGQTIRIKGRIDRIDWNPHTNNWVLLDYKTGESAGDPEKAHRKKGEWVDLQLPLYRHFASELGVEGNVQLGYITLPRDTNEIRDRLADWDDADLRDADARAREIGTRILDGEFWPPTDPPPRYAEDFAAICQDDVFDRRLPE